MPQTFFAFGLLIDSPRRAPRPKPRLAQKNECSKNGDDADRHKQGRRAHVTMHQHARIAQHVVPERYETNPFSRICVEIQDADHTMRALLQKYGE